MGQLISAPRNEIAPRRYLNRLASPHPAVQIFITNADALSPRQIWQLSGTLNESEQARVSLFHFKRDRQRQVATRAWLRYLLGAALHQPPSKLIFECDAKGKPRLVSGERDGRRLYFNLSHSDGFIVFARAWDREVGIDLEAVQHRAMRGRELDDLAARVFSPRELVLWRKLPDSAARRATFFRAWARKEAYLKGIGQGLAAELRAVEVMRGIELGNPCWRRSIGRWMLHDLSVAPEFAAALAVEEL